MVYTWTWNAISFPSQRLSYFNLYYAVFSRSSIWMDKNSTILCLFLPQFWPQFISIFIKLFQVFPPYIPHIFSCISIIPICICICVLCCRLISREIERSGVCNSLAPALYKWRGGHLFSIWHSHSDSPNLVRHQCLLLQ